ncbi:hypothetical protein ElyMa_000627900 [Elysia marginata]|uniref:Uncharacterized protein n=1 Tax=Elysia marginata TaxID=1093978 RepID=A0AAV4GCT4_9GAST|nr:hypothetical protein ElyMa_000627900 [Elysia marginata]
MHATLSWILGMVSLIASLIVQCTNALLVSWNTEQDAGRKENFKEEPEESSTPVDNQKFAPAFLTKGSIKRRNVSSSNVAKNLSSKSKSEYVLCPESTRDASSSQAVDIETSKPASCLDMRYIKDVQEQKITELSSTVGRENEPSSSKQRDNGFVVQPKKIFKFEDQPKPTEKVIGSEKNDTKLSKLPATINQETSVQKHVSLKNMDHSPKSQKDSQTGGNYKMLSGLPSKSGEEKVSEPQYADMKSSKPQRESANDVQSGWDLAKAHKLPSKPNNSSETICPDVKIPNSSSGKGKNVKFSTLSKGEKPYIKMQSPDVASPRKEENCSETGYKALRPHEMPTQSKNKADLSFLPGDKLVLTRKDEKDFQIDYPPIKTLTSTSGKTFQPVNKDLQASGLPGSVSSQNKHKKVSEPIYEQVKTAMLIEKDKKTCELPSKNEEATNATSPGMIKNTAEPADDSKISEQPLTEKYVKFEQQKKTKKGFEDAQNDDKVAEEKSRKSSTISECGENFGDPLDLTYLSNKKNIFNHPCSSEPLRKDKNDSQERNNSIQASELPSRSYNTAEMTNVSIKSPSKSGKILKPCSLSRNKETESPFAEKEEKGSETGQRTLKSQGIPAFSKSSELAFKHVDKMSNISSCPSSKKGENGSGTEGLGSPEVSTSNKHALTFHSEVRSSEVTQLPLSRQDQMSSGSRCKTLNPQEPETSPSSSKRIIQPVNAKFKAAEQQNETETVAEFLSRGERREIPVSERNLMNVGANEPDDKNINSSELPSKTCQTFNLSSLSKTGPAVKPAHGQDSSGNGTELKSQNMPITSKNDLAFQQGDKTTNICNLSLTKGDEKRSEIETGLKPRKLSVPSKNDLASQQGDKTTNIADLSTTRRDENSFENGTELKSQKMSITRDKTTNISDLSLARRDEYSSGNGTELKSQKLPSQNKNVLTSQQGDKTTNIADFSSTRRDEKRSENKTGLKPQKMSIGSKNNLTCQQEDRTPNNSDLSSTRIDEKGSETGLKPKNLPAQSKNDQAFHQTDKFTNISDLSSTRKDENSSGKGKGLKHQKLPAQNKNDLAFQEGDKTTNVSDLSSSRRDEKGSGTGLNPKKLPTPNKNDLAFQEGVKTTNILDFSSTRRDENSFGNGKELKPQELPPQNKNDLAFQPRDETRNIADLSSTRKDENSSGNGTELKPQRLHTKNKNDLDFQEGDKATNTSEFSLTRRDEKASGTVLKPQKLPAQNKDDLAFRQGDKTINISDLSSIRKDKISFENGTKLKPQNLSITNKNDLAIQQGDKTTNICNLSSTKGDEKRSEIETGLKPRKLSVPRLKTQKLSVPSKNDLAFLQGDKTTNIADLSSTRRDEKSSGPVLKLQKSPTLNKNYLTFQQGDKTTSTANLSSTRKDENSSGIGMELKPQKLYITSKNYVASHQGDKTTSTADLSPTRRDENTSGIGTELKAQKLYITNKNDVASHQGDKITNISDLSLTRIDENSSGNGTGLKPHKKLPSQNKDDVAFQQGDKTTNIFDLSAPRRDEKGSGTGLTLSTKNEKTLQLVDKTANTFKLSFSTKDKNGSEIELKRSSEIPAQSKYAPTFHSEDKSWEFFRPHSSRKDAKDSKTACQTLKAPQDLSPSPISRRKNTVTPANAKVKAPEQQKNFDKVLELSSKTKLDKMSEPSVKRKEESKPADKNGSFEPPKNNTSGFIRSLESKIEKAFEQMPDDSSKISGQLLTKNIDSSCSETNSKFQNPPELTRTILKSSEPGDKMGKKFNLPSRTGETLKETSSINLDKTSVGEQKSDKVFQPPSSSTRKKEKDARAGMNCFKSEALPTPTNKEKDFQQSNRNKEVFETLGRKGQIEDLHSPIMFKNMSAPNDKTVKISKPQDKNQTVSEFPSEDGKSIEVTSPNLIDKTHELSHKNYTNVSDLSSRRATKSDSETRHTVLEPPSAISSGTNRHPSVKNVRVPETEDTRCKTALVSEKPGQVSERDHKNLNFPEWPSSSTSGSASEISLSENCKYTEPEFLNQKDKVSDRPSVKKSSGFYELRRENITASSLQQLRKSPECLDLIDLSKDPGEKTSQLEMRNLKAAQSPSKSEKDSSRTEKEKTPRLSDKTRKVDHHIFKTETGSQEKYKTQNDLSQKEESKRRNCQSAKNNEKSAKVVDQESKVKQQVASSDTFNKNLSDTTQEKNKTGGTSNKKATDVTRLSPPEIDSRKQSDQAGKTGERAEGKGPHECEVMNSSFDAAEGGIQSWNRCTKNPGHSDFIPVSEFKMSHLPEGHQRDCVMECVRNVAACTGRLRVGYTSWARPNGYTFAVARGTKIQHTGSAYLYRVTSGKGRCPCPDDDGHDSPRKNWWKVSLQTACHVVYNTEEARNSKVDLHFDDEKASEDGRMKTLYGLEVTDQNHAGDRCEMVCVTHDEELVKKLQVLIDESRKLFGILSSQPAAGMKCDLCVIVSHPHGMQKYVTVGKMKGRIKMNGIGRRKFTYDTKTCPGSSGAPIIMPLGVTFWPVKSPWMAPHSSTEGDMLNKSGEGDVWWL